MTSKTSSAITTFIVRVSRGPGGRLSGTLERVRTGEKERVASAADVGAVIERMLGRDHPNRRRRRRPQEEP